MPPDDEGRALGPPNDENVVTTPPGSPTLTKTGSRLDDNPTPRRDGAAALWRRRRGADRCQPLGANGNCRDPWQPWRPPVSSRVQVDGAAAAARHLLDADLPPLFDTDICRAMWGRGHRRLAADCHRYRAAS